MKKLFYLPLLLCALTLVSCMRSPQANSAPVEVGSLSDARGYPDIDKITDPLVKERVEKIRASLKQDPAVLKLESLDDEQKTAQELALKDERFLRESRDEKT